MALPTFDLAPYLAAIKDWESYTKLQSGTLPSPPPPPPLCSADPEDGIAHSVAQGNEPNEEDPGRVFPPKLSDEVVTLCKDIANCLEITGSLVIRDPRCPSSDNDRFIDMMEKYFSSSEEFKQNQARPELHYQVGVTPGGVELPRSAIDPDMQAAISQQPEAHRAQLPAGPDLKWRYMWRIGPRPSVTKFKELNAEAVIPPGFLEWSEVMDGWGESMITALKTVAEMLAIGFELPRTTFTSLMHQGPHLLAPTGSDLGKYGKIGTVLAGYHYDLNFLTIHGRSRFPGLAIWLRDGRRVRVSVPDGCLLVQAGKQLEWVTGGVCAAGMHEVIVDEKTAEAIRVAREAKRSLWRVSSTLFGHIASDAVLEPKGRFAQSKIAHLYPAMSAGDYVEAELAAISLKNKATTSS